MAPPFSYIVEKFQGSTGSQKTSQPKFVWEADTYNIAIRLTSAAVTVTTLVGHSRNRAVKVTVTFTATVTITVVARGSHNHTHRHLESYWQATCDASGQQSSVPCRAVGPSGRGRQRASKGSAGSRAARGRQGVGKGATTGGACTMHLHLHHVS